MTGWYSLEVMKANKLRVDQLLPVVFRQVF
jgi:hypothetical protein